MTKKLFVILIGLIIATTLGSVGIAIYNVDYFSWYQESVINRQNNLAERKEYRENTLKKYPEEEITADILYKMLFKKENGRSLSDVLILLPARKKISGVLTDEVTYSLNRPNLQINADLKPFLELAKNQTPIDLRGKPHFLDDKTKNAEETIINNFLEAKTFLGRLDGYKKYKDFYGLWEGSEDSTYSLTLIIVIDTIYLLLFGFTIYWMRKCYKLSRKV